jgi:hypothetical protein
MGLSTFWAIFSQTRPVPPVRDLALFVTLFDFPTFQSPVHASAFSRLDGDKLPADELSSRLKRKSEPIVRLREEPPGRTADSRLREETFTSSDARLREETFRSSETEVAPPKKKRLLMIRTLPDGSKEERIISPDDPILKKVNANPVLPKNSLPARCGYVSL